MMVEQENTNSAGLPPKFIPLMFQDSRNPQQLYNSPIVNRQSSSGGIPLKSPSRVLFPSPNVLPRSANTSLNSGVLSQPVVSQSTPTSTTSLIGISRNQHSVSIDDHQISTSNTNKSVPMGPPLQQVHQNVQRNLKIKTETEKKGLATESQLQDVSNQVQLLQSSSEKLLEILQDLKSEIQNDRRRSQESNNGGVTMAALNEVRKARSTWISQMQSFQQHNDALNEAVEADFNRKIDEKEAQVNDLCGRVEQLSTELGSMTEERDGTKRKLNEIIHELDRVILDKDRFFKERNQFEKENDHLTRSFKKKLDEKEKKFLEEFAEEQTRSQAIIQKLNDCQDKISALEVDLQMMISEKEELSRENQQEIASLNKNITNLKSANEVISSQLIAAEEQLVSHQKTIACFGDIKVALEDVSKERTLLQERCTMLEAQLVTMNENITLSMNERVNKVIRELSEERSRSQEILRELKESRDKIRDLQVDHQKIISDLKEVSRADHTEIALLKQKIEKLDATKDDLSSRLIAADRQLASQHQTITNFGDIKVALADVSKERASLQERFTALEAQLLETEENLSCSAAHNVELERALEDMNRQMKDKTELINKTRQEVDGLSQQLTASSAVMGEKLEMISTLERQLAATKESVREMQEILTKNSVTSKELKNQLHECNKEQIEYEKQIAGLKRDVMGNAVQLTYKEKQITELKNLQVVKQEPSVRDSKIVAELEGTKQRLKRKMSELKSSQSQLKENQEKRVIAESQLKENQEKLTIAEKNVAVLQSQNAALKKSLDETLRQKFKGATNSQPPRPVEVLTASSQRNSSVERIDYVSTTPRPKTPTNVHQRQSIDVLTGPSKSNNRPVERQEVTLTPTIQTKSILKKHPFSVHSNHEETLALIRQAEEKADAIKRSKEMPTTPSSSSSTPSCPLEKRRRFDTGTPQTRFPLSQNHRSSNGNVQQASSASPHVNRPEFTYARKTNQETASKDRRT